MITDVYGSRVFAVIVSAHKILLQVPGKKGSIFLHVFPPAHIYTRGKVLASEHLRGNRPAGKVILGMEGRNLHARRKNGLVVYIGMGGYVGPIQKVVRVGGGVIDRQLSFKISFSRPDGYSRRPAHPVPGFGFANDNGFAAVLMFDHGVIQRQHGGSPVVMQYAPLDSARNPGAGHPDIRRFYFIVFIDEVVIIGFIGGIIQLPAYFRRDAKLDILIFQQQGFPGDFLPLMRYHIIQCIGINDLPSALIVAAGVKHRRFFRGHHPVGGQGPHLLRHFDLCVKVGSADQKKQYGREDGFKP